MPNRKNDEQLDEAVQSSRAAARDREDEDRNPIETWASIYGLQQHRSDGAPNPDNWKFIAAKARRKWQDGQAVTQAEFDEGIAGATESEPIR